ncbi:hypothetical protein N2603_04840 [Bradyrhizobium huanghuaihaiense]|uniref:hypothetical protein n=1 Tax=Bradyrhizobium huanghuaihaiense TaxID=990078 RepID=UPI0021AA3D19|nr:hypothetical protein [Bradyrhizobium sp. CB3035]UWU77801.1 hypothetical protein N2603_04840 [Bradyrhizobium sp. CB3035]
MPILIKGAANAMQTVRSQADTRTAQGNSAQQKGGRACDRLVCHSGAREARALVRNCAPENLEILRCASAHHSSMLRIAPG